MTVWCSIRLANGSQQTIGSFPLAGGYGSWGAPVAVSASSIRSARAVGADGRVIASAVLR